MIAVYFPKESLKELRLSKSIKRIVTVMAFVVVLHKLLVWTQPMGSLLDDLKVSREVFDRNGKLLRLQIAKDEFYRIQTKLEEISPFLVQATLLYEDKYFYTHLGVNPVSLFRAVWSTYVSKKRILGASTISMQLSRLKYRINTRSVGGKLRQLLTAQWLEFLYSKDDILEAYLNLAPYGFNVEGIGAASRIYFDKSAHRLNILESMTLAVIPQSPNLRTAHVTRNQNENTELKNARSSLWQEWQARFPQWNDSSTADNLKVQMRSPRTLPFYAPHYTTDLMANKNLAQLWSTLDLDIQLLFEEKLRSYIRQNESEGVYNGALLLLDANTMQILASIGSVDFNSKTIGGQVNGVKARRSPGSALKPFAYALALQQGVIHPQTMLKDTKTQLGTYNPDNFDREYFGPVLATDALIHSRNVPAIELTRQLNSPTLYDFLKSAGIPLISDPQHYGLSLVLGTAEVTMEEVANLYAMFLNQGKLKRLIKEKSDVGAEGTPLLTPESAFLILDMLAKNPVPVQPFSRQWNLNSHTVAWKTGTSVGYRDAWAVVVFDHYVLVTWLGNFSGLGNPKFVGRSLAGPLAFELIEGMRNIREVNFPAFAPVAKLNLAQVEVCALSGSLPGQHCAHKKQTWFIPEVSPISVCTIHRKVSIDPVSGLQVCPEFQSKLQRKVESKILEFWSTDMLQLYKQAGVARKQPPSFHSICKKESYQDIGPQIISPREHISYILRTTGSDSKEIPLMAISDGNVKKHRWFVDNSYIGEASADTPLVWSAGQGRHHIKVLDDQGRSAIVAIRVEYVD